MREILEQIRTSKNKNILELFKQLIDKSEKLQAFNFEFEKYNYCYVESVQKKEDAYLLYVSYGWNRQNRLIYGLTSSNKEIITNDIVGNYQGISHLHFTENNFLEFKRHYGFGSTTTVTISNEGVVSKREEPYNYGCCCN